MPRFQIVATQHWSYGDMNLVPGEIVGYLETELAPFILLDGERSGRLQIQTITEAPKEPAAAEVPPADPTDVVPAVEETSPVVSPAVVTDVAPVIAEAPAESPVVEPALAVAEPAPVEPITQAVTDPAPAITEPVAEAPVVAEPTVVDPTPVAPAATVAAEQAPAAAPPKPKGGSFRSVI